MSPAPVTVHAQPLAQDDFCADHFLPQDLDHVTATDDGEVRMFEANGSKRRPGRFGQRRRSRHRPRQLRRRQFHSVERR
ncbi:MAG: hypothetical protein R2856_19430 [Caldilineaceae bacterium]